jgi:hypothetical protein
VCNQRTGSASPKQDGLIHLDLADEFWRCVEIGANGWRIAEDPKLLRAVIDPNVATATSLPHKSMRPNRSASCQLAEVLVSRKSLRDHRQGFARSPQLQPLCDDCYV